MPDTRYQIPDARCQMPDAGCSMPDARCSMLDTRYSNPIHNPLTHTTSIQYPFYNQYHLMVQFFLVHAKTAKSKNAKTANLFMIDYAL